MVTITPGLKTIPSLGESIHTWGRAFGAPVHETAPHSSDTSITIWANGYSQRNLFILHLLLFIVSLNFVVSRRTILTTMRAAGQAPPCTGIMALEGVLARV